METASTSACSSYTNYVPPSGGSLEIGNVKVGSDRVVQHFSRSPFGGIPRNWKPFGSIADLLDISAVPPSGGSLEIGNSAGESQ